MFLQAATMMFFCCVAKSRGIPITPSNSSVIEWGRMLGSMSPSKVPSFGLSAHCQSAVVSRGTSLLGMKCPDEKTSCSHCSQSRFSVLFNFGGLNEEGLLQI